MREVRRRDPGRYRRAHRRIVYALQTRSSAPGHSRRTTSHHRTASCRRKSGNAGEAASGQSAKDFSGGVAGACSSSSGFSANLVSRPALALLALRTHARVPCRLNSFVRLFSFAKPEDFNATLSSDSLYSELLTHGYLPLGYESDGNLWVIESPYGAASKVYMLDLSGWGGGEPTKGGGLVFAASRFSLLLCSMGISDVSYQDLPTGTTSVIWHEDCE